MFRFVFLILDEPLCQLAPETKQEKATSVTKRGQRQTRIRKLRQFLRHRLPLRLPNQRDSKQDDAEVMWLDDRGGVQSKHRPSHRPDRNGVFRERIRALNEPGKRRSLSVIYTFTGSSSGSFLLNRE